MLLSQPFDKLRANGLVQRFLKYLNARPDTGIFPGTHNRQTMPHRPAWIGCLPDDKVGGGASEP